MSSIIRRALPSAALFGALMLPLALPAQQEAPTAAALLARHVEAIGGATALQGIKSIRQSGSMEMPAMGISAQVEVFQAKPNRMLTRTTIPGVGEVLTGTDGSAAWSVDPMQGPRLLAGAESEQLRASSNLDAAMLMRPEDFTKMELAGSKDFGEEPTYGVELTSKLTGKTGTYYFSKQSGLLVAIEAVQESPAGNLPVTTVLSGYKVFSGCKFPTRTETSIGTTQMVTTISEISINSVPDSTFAIPDVIKPLMKK